MSRTRTLFTRSFWLDTAERAVKAFAGGSLGTLTATAVGASVAWPVVLFAGAVSGVTMVLLSAASAPVPAISPASAVPAGA
jgi:hypothetical protein